MEAIFLDYCDYFNRTLPSPSRGCSVKNSYGQCDDVKTTERYRSKRLHALFDNCLVNCYKNVDAEIPKVEDDIERNISFRVANTFLLVENTLVDESF